MAIVFAAPFIPVAPSRTWIGLQMTWTGWDGSVWDLTSAASGAVMMPGLRGLTMPPVQHYTTSYPSVPGARWRGHTVNAREVFWPIQLYSDQSSQDWVEHERAFWKTMRPDKTGTWTVTGPSGDQRYLDCRFSDDGEATFSHDPVLAGWSNYGITLTADQPFWRADPVRRQWSAGASVPFYPAGSGSGFVISPSTTLDASVIENPGDVDAYPVWEVSGPATTAQVGVAGRNITIPFAIAAGKVLVIDTAPSAQSATLYDVGTGGVRVNPVDKTAQLSGVDFAPVPADGSTSVTLTLAGTGNVVLSLTPLYLRAW